MVNDLSWDDCTALYYTVLGGHIDIVKLLLQHGGDKTVNNTDFDGTSPLHNSVIANSVYENYNQNKVTQIFSTKINFSKSL